MERWKKPLRDFRIALVPILATLASAGNACMTEEPLHFEDIRQADAIFVGKILKYEVFSPGRPDSLEDYGVITAQVRTVLKGDVPKTIELYWWNSTFGMPESLPSSDAMLFAAVSAHSRQPPLRGPSATIFPSRRPDLLQVMQAPCSSPFILPYDQRSSKAVRDALAGSSSVEFDPYAIDAGLTYHEIKAIHSAERRTNPFAFAAGAIGAVIALLIGKSIWELMRKRGVTE